MRFPDENQSHEGDAASAASPGTLYVVATPIGNLSDITLRALAVLKSADAIACEDTRNSATLLAHHGIHARTFAAHEHNEREAAQKIIGLLEQGGRIALISDAGTPAISDPGARLVRAVRQAGHPVVPIPGANAAAAALSASGFEGPFHFAGFLPAKTQQRRNALRELAALPATVVLYEAPHRILDLARDLTQELETSRGVVLARELTKRFESIHACAAGELVQWLEGDANRQRGEFVVLIEAAAPRAEDALDSEALRVLGLLLEELPVKGAAKLASAITGAPRNALYAKALEMKKAGEA
jgi:16S rRNA (cytidine1402-2'-O)-methyltransferase